MNRKKRPAMNRQGVKITRKNIPDATRLKLWVCSGGRCQFCNKKLWHHSLTLNEGNFAEFAHIIGASPDGPRGGVDSEKLQIEYENLLLLCAECHKLVDDNPEEFSVYFLQKKKKEHEERIETLTEIAGEPSRSTVLFFSVKINDRFTPIHFGNAKNAMLPKFPVDTSGIKIEDTDFDSKTAQPDEWQSFAENKIARKIHSRLEQGVNDDTIKHLSVFAIGPMPLLMYLGKCIGSTVPTDVYQSFRNEPNPWKWPVTVSPDCNFIINRLENETNSKTVLLKLAISDTLPREKHANLPSDVVYEITVEKPSPSFISSIEQVRVFSKIYRDLLNEIQFRHGTDCHIFLLPAVPLYFAVECGRALLPRKDSPITVCEFDKDEKRFRPVLRLIESNPSS